MMKRYDVYGVQDFGGLSISWDEDENGDWIRYEDYIKEKDSNVAHSLLAGVAGRELHEIIKHNKNEYDEDFLIKEYNCDRWILEAQDEIGDGGMYFMYFVAGFRCCETIK
jgi:hypothetical protein